jgi:transcription elongation factor Elf1
MTLPEWQVERVEVRELNYKSILLITCPRCKYNFYVSLSWRRKNRFGTAPCPFCFKTNKIPDRN